MIANNYDSFVCLWRQVRQTYEHFRAHHQRFCVRRIIQHWRREGIITDQHLRAATPQSDGSSSESPLREGDGGVDNLIWEICFRSELQGYDDLGPPDLYPRPLREMIRSLVSVTQGIGMRKVLLRDLDRAYSEVFPDSTPINVAKKKRKE